jgi:hypothetical protein
MLASTPATSTMNPVTTLMTSHVCWLQHPESRDPTALLECNKGAQHTGSKNNRPTWERSICRDIAGKQLFEFTRCCVRGRGPRGAARHRQRTNWCDPSSTVGARRRSRRKDWVGRQRLWDRRLTLVRVTIPWDACSIATYVPVAHVRKKSIPRDTLYIGALM